MAKRIKTVNKEMLKDPQQRAAAANAQLLVSLLAKTSCTVGNQVCEKRLKVL